MDPIDPIRELPHGPPFVFLDEVVERTPGKRAVCANTFEADNPVFEGHFPGDPLVPGVLLAEAMAQASGLAAPEGSGKMLLASIRKMNFPSAARPGERVEIEAVFEGALGEVLLFGARASVGGRCVAEGQLVLGKARGEK